MQFFYTLLSLLMFTVTGLSGATFVSEARADEVHEHKTAIHVMDAYTLALKTPSGTGAIFMTLHNSDAENTARLIGVDVPSDIAKKAELHTHMMDGDIMKMRQVESIEIGPNAHKTLEPGGDHVMIFGMEKELVAGTSFPVTLQFEKSDPQVIDVKVLPIGQTPDKTHRH